MALIKINKDKMTPEMIRNGLFYYSDVAHQFHLDTKSFAIHKAIGKLYEGLIDFRDEICEKLMGYLGGDRLPKIKMQDFPDYSDAACVKLAADVEKFAHSIYEWAEDKEYCDIENLAQSLSGLAAQTTYLLTLK